MVPMNATAEFTLAIVATALVALACVSPAATASIPLPPIRPPDLGAPAPEKPAVQPTAEDNDTLRAQVLASRRIIGEALAPIADGGGCGMAAPLRVEAIVLADGGKVTLSPSVTLRAAMVSALADWVREDLAPAIAARGDRLAGLEGVGGYECRTRNAIAGATLSEHAIGNALDMHGFATASSKYWPIAAQKSAETGDAQAFATLMKTTACKRFSTVLGPGSDGFHAQHLHIDLAARRSGTRLCQWSLEDVTAGAPAKQ